MIVNNRINKLNKPTILTQFKKQIVYNIISKQYNTSINSIKYKKYNRFLWLKNVKCFEPLPPPILPS